MKYVLTYLLVLCWLHNATAQQTPQYSLYMLNPYLYNPAYAGMDNSLSITGVFRNQWSGLAGNPETRAITAHTPLYIANGGIGFSLENETIGSWEQTAMNAGYSYALRLGDAGILSIGVGVGFIQRQLDGASVRTPGTLRDDEGNPIDHQDPILTTGILSGSGVAFQAGVFFQKGPLNVSISVLNLTESAVNMGAVQYIPDRTTYLSAAYNFGIGQQFVLTPSAMMKSDARQTQVEVSAILTYNENMFGGASYRGLDANSQDAIVLLLGLKLSEKLSLAYAYDFTQSRLNSVSNGSHELQLNYNLNKPIGQGRPPAIIYNPRSL